MNKFKKEAIESTKKWIEEDYGSRCKVLAHGCPSCDKWFLFDILFAEYDGEYTWNKKIRNTPDNEAHRD